VSSPYLRARQTIEPLAKRTGKEIQLVEDLRERNLSHGLIDDFIPQMEESWRNFDHALPGCGTSRNAQERVVSAMASVARKNEGRNVIASSHGNLIALFLNHIREDFGFSQWKEMRNPDVFRIVWSGLNFGWDRECDHQE
jgi:2,3-bisphosphoglycerate-dependent phosphoglycerate mutase